MQTYLLCLWPVCQNSAAKACLKRLLPQYGFELLKEENRIYSYEQFWELIAHIYCGESWAAYRQGIGVLKKSLWCYQADSPVTFYLIKACGGQISELLALKNEFREQNGGHKHSLHTVDDPEVSQEIWHRYVVEGQHLTSPHPKIWYLAKAWMQLRIRIKKRMGCVDE